MSAPPVPAPTIPPRDTKLAALRVGAYGLVLLISAAGEYLGVRWLSALGGLLGIVAGKLLGTPLASVLENAMQHLAATQPERASAVAVQTLASLPPASLAPISPALASIASMAPPPRAPDRPTVISFVGDEPERESTEPTRPDRPHR